MKEKDSKNKELLKNTFIIFIGKFCTQFISFLLVPLYTKYLITSDYGYVDLILTYISLILPILILRSDSSIFRYLIDERDNKKERAKTVTSLFVLIIIQIFALVLLSTITNMIFKIQYIVSIILSTIMYAFSSMALQYIRGIGDNIGYSIASIISGITTLIINIVLIVLLKVGGVSILISTIIANIFCVLYIAFRTKVYREIRRDSFSEKKLKKMLKYSIPMIPDRTFLVDDKCIW